MKNIFTSFIFYSVLLINLQAQNLKNLNILLYTKNGPGYVHDNIPYAVKCFETLAKQKNFRLTISDTSLIFIDEKLKNFDIIVFANTNNDVFTTDGQRLSFRRYIEAGGSFLGIHSVLGTERKWTWFKNMMGGSFLWHPKFQTLQIKKIQHNHPAVAGLPEIWTKGDECYFMKELYVGSEVLMAHDLRVIQGDSVQTKRVNESKGYFDRYYPAVWIQKYDGGKIWITTLGHDKSDYADPVYVQHLLSGMQYLATRKTKLNYSKAYALSRDQELK